MELSGPPGTILQKFNLPLTTTGTPLKLSRPSPVLDSIVRKDWYCYWVESVFVKIA